MNYTITFIQSPTQESQNLKLGTLYKSMESTPTVLSAVSGGFNGLARKCQRQGYIETHIQELAARIRN